jgi:hypothetical protein
VAVAYRRLAEEVMDRLVALEARRAANDGPAPGLAAPPSR